MYLDHVRQSLESAASNIENDFYATSINRSYYAIFYAASVLLLTKDISRSKHGGVIAAFRQHFVKPGLIETEYSDIYGDVMEARVDSDYDMTFDADPTTAAERLVDARRFVERVIQYLQESEWL
ncbi:MAG: HEPN domain-containing protein [Chloroflexi bacterium]|nr:MAG: HEPN domain-containing protein [Chloroflexota bacterium]